MSLKDQSKYCVLDQLLSKNYRFAIYRLPHYQKVNFILQTDNRPTNYNDFYTLGKNKGFVVSPFSISITNPVVLIIPNIYLEGEDVILNYIKSQTWHQNKILTKDIDEGLDNYQQYESRFNFFQQKIDNHEVDKLVLSRTKDILREQISVGEIFEKAIHKYPNNFVYLCNTPESGAWLGCSPEILLSGRQNIWKTHALAGTQKIESEIESIIWDDKNRQEHTVVFDYLKNNLQNIGLQTVGSVAKTIQSGDLAHLRSEFTFETNDMSSIDEVLTQLHPTPAVCGYPKDKALDIICNNEGYDRAYYSGFVGCYNIDNNSDLYVNLRCMQIFEDKFRLYAGGGIMPQSTAQSEWQETEYKLQTILSIL